MNEEYVILRGKSCSNFKHSLCEESREKQVF